MPWLPEEHMADVHIIRQDYAQALERYQSAAYQSPESNAALEVLTETIQRRARAIRMIHEEDGANVRILAGMFRCSKTVIREALEGGDD